MKNSLAEHIFIWYNKNRTFVVFWIKPRICLNSKDNYISIKEYAVCILKKKQSARKKYITEK